MALKRSSNNNPEHARFRFEINHIGTKKLKISADANTVRIVFYGLESPGKTGRIVCFDNIIISSGK